jgi:hypothetical protein
MATKIIDIVVPLNWNVPDVMKTFNAEENALILSMGSEIIKDTRNSLVCLSQKEIYNKIREETKEEIKKLEFDLLVQKSVNNELEIILTKKYEGQIEQLNKQIETMRNQIKNYDVENKDIVEDIVRSEVDKTQVKFNAIIETKDKIIETLSSNYEKIQAGINSLNNKSTSHKGREGEDLFEYYANETFRDFKGYNLIDKHTQVGAGDFHMQFEEFDVLVDAKNYKKKVPIDQREKIKKDLLKNEHLTFAWLVSLNTSIDKFDQGPIMCEWPSSKQCILYINNLTEYEDPRKILRIAWFISKIIYDFFKELTTDNNELQEMKDEKIKLMDRVRKMRKIMREINTTLNTTRNMLQQLDDEFKEILSSESEKLITSNYAVFDEWWDTNIELTNDDNKILSTDMWFKFKHDSKASMEDFDVTPEKFKQYVKAKMPMTSIILKSKNANTAFDIKGIKFKKNNSKKPVEKIDLVIGEGINGLENKKEIVKQKIVKASSKWSDEEEKRLIEEYTIKELDIREIAELHNRKEPGILFRLEKLKLINNQESARGYAKYKETEKSI